MQLGFIMSKLYIRCHRSFVGGVNPLPLTIKSLNRNVELIKITSDFGHELSYSKFLEINAVFFTKKIAQTESRILLPAKTRSNKQYMKILTTWKKRLVSLVY